MAHQSGTPSTFVMISNVCNTGLCRSTGRAITRRAEITALAVQASPELDVHLGTHDRFQFLGHRLDHRPVTNVGLGALGAAPRHGVALGAPVASRPPPNCGHFGPVVAWLPIDLDRQLPADRRLPVNGRLARIEGRQVQRAPAPPSNPARLRKMQAPSTTRVLLRVVSPKTPPSAAMAWYSKREGSNVAASAPIRRASSSPSRSAPIEQQPWPSSAAGCGRIPRQPRPQMQVQFELRNERSKRHVVSPAEISVIIGSMGAQRKGRTR